MVEEIKATWRSDLLSGAYPQTSGALNREWAYEADCVCLPGVDCTCEASETAPVGLCCLGVLCEQAVRAGIAERTPADEKGRIGYRRAGSDDEIDYDLPPICVYEWAGLDDNNPQVRHDGLSSTLSFVNDEREASFLVIAGLLDQL
jgi:hypothetical protein